MIRGIEVAKQYARGVWYASPYIYQRDKWAVYSPTGVCVSIHDNKKEAVSEALKHAEEKCQESK